MPKENDRDRFKRMATDRVNRFKQVCLAVSNLADTRYHYTKEEVLWYMNQVKVRVDEVKKEFFNPKLKRSTIVIEEIPQMAVVQWSNSEDVANAKFHELMPKRLNRLVSILNLLLNLTNKSHYRYMNGDVKQMFAYINRALDVTQSHFVGIDDFKFVLQGEESEDDGIARPKR